MLSRPPNLNDAMRDSIVEATCPTEDRDEDFDEREPMIEDHDCPVVVVNVDVCSVCFYDPEALETVASWMRSAARRLRRELEE